MIELLLSKATNVYNYFTSTSGVTQIGSLIRKDDERGYSLDLFENESIPITYAISDAQDATVKKSPFSKNFLIPGTKRNSIALGYPYMISNDVPFKTYNGEVVNGNEWHVPIQEAQLYVDGILAFTGELELSKTVINQGEINSFEVNFLATTINIFDELEGKNMRDLTLPTPNITNGQEIIDCFNATSSDDTFGIADGLYSGFTLAYPDWGFQPAESGATYLDGVPVYATTGETKIFTDSGTPPTDTNDIGLVTGYNFTQYAFVKKLVDTIFDGVDFNYNSTFFDSETFKKLLLLCYDSNELPSNTRLNIFGSNPSSSTYYGDIFGAFPTSTPSPVTYNITNLTAEGTVPGASPFDANKSLSDPFSVWDADSGVLTFTRTGTYTIQLKSVVDIRFGWDMQYGGQGAPCPGSGGTLPNVYPWATYPLLGALSTLKWTCQNRSTPVVSQSISGLSMTSTSIATPSTYSKLFSTHYQWESSHDGYTTPLNFTLNVQAGDEWALTMTTDPASYANAPVQSGCTTFPMNERKYQAALDVLAVDVSPYAFNWSQTLPDITQKDFLVALFKHFNLYSEVTPNSRTIEIEPRDVFFNNVSVQDWTNKLDISSLREIQRSDPPISVTARMKKTSNVQDKNSQETTLDELEYGSFKTFLENGKDQEQEIKSEFGSLTPTFMRSLQGLKNKIQTTATYDSTDYRWVIPNPELFAVASNGERELTDTSEMYLAYRPNIVSPVSLISSGYDQVYAHFAVQGATGYTGTLEGPTGAPGADHLWSISSIGETGLDVNFANTKTAWLSGGQVPRPPVFENVQTNYEEYYQNYFLNLNDQKILKGKFRLQPADIARFSFRNPIWLTFPNGDGDYFIVSSINYDPTTNGPSDVELLTFNKEYFNFSFSSFTPIGDIPVDVGDDPPDYLPPPDQEPGGGEYPIGGTPPST